jgi:hypothetical protein
MSYQLVVHEIPRDHLTHNNYNLYMNFLKHVDTHGWPYAREEQKQWINHMLAHYNARLAEYHYKRIVFEFDTCEDLAQFVLTWS